MDGSDKILICVCRGGLANRLKPLASCFALARRSGRALAIDWTADSHCQASFSELYQNEIGNVGFDWVQQAESLKLYADRNSVEEWNFTELVRIIEQHDFSQLSRACEIASDPHEAVVVYGNDFLEGVIASDLREFFDWLTPIQSIRERIGAVCADLGIGRSLVGVHARGSDFGASVESYLTRMRELRKRTPNVRFFVASDTEEFERAILREFPDTITNAKSAYVERRNPGDVWSTANINRSAASVAEAIVDMHLLAETDFRIYNPYSSFAHVVNFMSHGVIERFPSSRVPPLREATRRFVSAAVKRIKRLFEQP